MDERYPIGTFHAPGEITSLQREAWIQEIERLPSRLRSSVEGLNEQELNTPYREGGWRIKQVVHHVADSHMNSYIRFKLALTEETPTIKPYYEERWAELGDTVNADIELSLALIDHLHKRWAILLRSLTDSDYKKLFFHPGSKETYALDYTLGSYAWHGNHHVAHIMAFRNKGMKVMEGNDDSISGR
ncbi:metal-dependent hydrolase [Bacillus sp. FJAT-26390]|nr:metal-dependent hydrolase [Bacillus sp. FJAT-26390]